MPEKARQRYPEPLFVWLSARSRLRRTDHLRRWLGIEHTQADLLGMIEGKGA